MKMLDHNCEKKVLRVHIHGNLHCGQSTYFSFKKVNVFVLHF